MKMNYTGWTSKGRGLIAAMFDLSTADGTVLASCTSAPLFSTSMEAAAAGKRAEDYAATHGKIPNICEKF